ncbi:hypothetical protein ACFWG0_26600 [Streptomyces yangpuensis]|uniref:hypothetical protein n=1 Tax=Streptomyces yangpuensis TaxID=1648182 RepID=UPI0036637FB7
MNDFTDPQFEPLTEFDVLMLDNEINPTTALDAMFDEAEELLLATRPEGFEVEEIGRLAFDRLPEVDKAKAFDTLLYTYWAARDHDRKVLARLEAEGGGSRG